MVRRHSRLPPDNPFATCQPNHAEIAQSWSVQRRIHSIAASQNAVLVDVYSTFNGDATTLVDCGGLHPTAAGYQRIVDTSSTRFSKRSSWRRRQLPPA